MPAVELSFEFVGPDEATEPDDPAVAAWATANSACPKKVNIKTHEPTNLFKFKPHTFKVVIFD